MTSILALVRTPVRRSALFMSVLACLALVAGIANSAASVGFPVGARWERVVNALVTIDLLVIVVVLTVAAVITSRAAASETESVRTVIDQRGADIVRPRVGALALAGTVLLAADWVLWLVFGLPVLIGAALTNGAAYLAVTAATAVSGPLWVLGTVLAVIGFHRGGSVQNRRTALLGAVLTVAEMGLVVLLAMLFAGGVIR
ncbi:MAG: hypothetical protein HY996_08010 [Micrococcales bacterium]|nr:hypothetical protein [Micrococcales bacterium]